MLKRLAIVLLALPLFACDFDDVPDFLPDNGVTTDYRQEMRDLVIEISRYAKRRDRDFIIVPQDALPLVTSSGQASGTPETAYLNALDGIAQQGVFFGLNTAVDQPTPAAQSDNLQQLLNIARDDGDLVALVTDFASSEANIDESIRLNQEADYLGFAAPQRLLNTIPSHPTVLPGENRADIEDLTFARNFLQLINPSSFASPQAFVDAVADTDYDVVILDFFFNGEPYSQEQLQQMRLKRDGGERLLLAYMSIGQAQSDLFYWEDFWLTNPPIWLDEQVAESATNYHVRYWLEPWQEILFGGEGAYLDRIIDAGYDGAYLDNVDEFEFFEAQ
ncbi:endo alpha-1,4 polygalactosaminidase [Microbulbifer sp. 2201CG32-9]|uniref:endo alpha-1,4 polygalactosaminidase n=1 Tax=Microbulbifer sp. 2201CG32-9 TaxID=3232309 RepID=UPI00345B71ED